MKIKNDLKLSEIIGSLFCTSVILLFVVMLIVQVGCERKPISPQEAAPAVETPVVDVFAMTDEQIRQRINELYAEMMNLKRQAYRFTSLHHQGGTHTY